MANPMPIPGPPGLPLLGNLNDIDPANGIESFCRIADTYGEIFKLRLGASDFIFISSHRLINELCDETRFTKMVGGALKELRSAVEDGLFTAFPGEHNWGVAHRTLMPAFGPLSIRDMFDEMHDIASQLVVKWARFGGEEIINVTDDFTRLTLDTLALCAMDARFNSFYKQEMHPFVDAMISMLQEAGAKVTRPGLANRLMRSKQRKYAADISLCQKIAADLIQARREHPSEKHDLLNTMLKGTDPKTGEHMTDKSILNNMITFIIAGHETTSGLLSFLFYFLLKNPSAYQAAQAEVDQIIGSGPIKVDHMSQLPYLSACLRETLRLTPTAPVFGVQILPDSTEANTFIGGGKYQIKKGQVAVALLPKIHRDPAVYGEDADDFKPERMLDEPFSKLPPNSWKPFGNGIRGCIGRPFAWQEALLATAILLQNFNFRFDDPSYTLAMKQTLTLKPKEFFMHATVKRHINLVHLERNLHVDNAVDSKMVGKRSQITRTSSMSMKPMTILYGSNSGTCEALSQSLARAAIARGYTLKVNILDSAVDEVPKDQLVVMISSSYEGQPPDNAAHFIAWLDSLKAKDALKGVRYAVYGCGNHDWVSTFHKVPKHLDTAFTEHGATRIVSAGLGDVASGDIFSEFDMWQEEVFWPALGGSRDQPDDEDNLEIEIDTALRKTTLRQDVDEAMVISNKVLTTPGEREKRHMELKLPTGMTYRAGDYLAVLPVNNADTVHRALKRFGLPWDAMLNIKASVGTTLPTDHPVSAMDCLGAYVELSQPATRKNIHKIASTIPDETERAKVSDLAARFENEVLLKRLSPLDILEAHPNAALSLSSFLSMLPPMRIRQYSISSSALHDHTLATLTWSVIDAPSKTASGKRFLGVASNYLSDLEVGDRILVTVRPSRGPFQLPSDVENTPIIMLCAGSGIAPFRGFVQERAIQHAAGRKLAGAYLFIGCAHPERDTLFSEELKAWENEGIVKVYYAFSKAKEESKGAKYVQERLWEEREEMAKVFEEGAKVYICGGAKVAEGVAATMKRIYAYKSEELCMTQTEEEVEAWFQRIKRERYASDIFV